MTDLRTKFELETGKRTEATLDCSNWDYIRHYIRWLEKKLKLEQDKKEIRKLIKEQNEGK